MKKTLTLIGAILAMAVINLNAQTTIEDDALVTFKQIADAKNLTLAISPSYAPDLENQAGESDPWGFGVSLTYRPVQDGILSHLFAGTQIDYIGSEFLAVSVTGGLKADFQVMSQNFTTFAYGGAVKPLNGSDVTDWGTMGGVGLKTTIKTFTIRETMTGAIDVGGAVEKWTKFDGEVYRVGVALTIRW